MNIVRFLFGIIRSSLDLVQFVSFLITIYIYVWSSVTGRLKSFVLLWRKANYLKNSGLSYNISLRHWVRFNSCSDLPTIWEYLCRTNYLTLQKGPQFRPLLLHCHEIAFHRPFSWGLRTVKKHWRSNLKNSKFNSSILLSRPPLPYLNLIERYIPQAVGILRLPDI